MVLVALAGLPACRDPNLVRIEQPAAGVRVFHDLKAGVARSGHVNVKDGAREVDADVRWESLGDADEGGTRVKASFSEIASVWAGADDATHDRVAKAEVSIHVVTGGAATATVAPTGHAVADEIAGVLADALARSFVVVPAKSLKRGDDWTWAPRAGTTGDVQAAVEGLFRMRDTGLDVLELSLRQKQAGDERGRALFATDGFVALYEIRDNAGRSLAVRVQ